MFESSETRKYYQVDSYKEQIFFTKSAAFTPNTLSEISITINPLKLNIRDIITNYNNSLLILEEL